MIELYYENYILINTDTPNFEDIKKKYFDNEGNIIVLLDDNYSIQSPFEYFTPVMYSDPDGHFAILASLLIGLAIGMSVSAAASFAGDYDKDNKLFDNNEDRELYLQNMIRGLAIGGMTGLLGPIGFVFSYSAFVLKDLIDSQNDGKIVTYNGNKQIENSYKVLELKAKMEYIRSNDISSKTGMTEYQLLAEWELHNIAYYLDIFGILRKHTKTVDFG